VAIHRSIERRVLRQLRGDYRRPAAGSRQDCLIQRRIRHAFHRSLSLGSSHPYHHPDRVDEPLKEAFITDVEELRKRARRSIEKGIVTPAYRGDFKQAPFRHPTPTNHPSAPPNTAPEAAPATLAGLLDSDVLVAVILR
jgi:hypothetical protein